MKAFLFLTILVLCNSHIFCDEIKCALASPSCALKYQDIISDITNKDCDAKAPIFACLREKGCSRDDQTYEAQVKAYNYEKCGASAIIMGWTLPVLMFSLVKYFTRA